MPFVFGFNCNGIAFRSLQPWQIEQVLCGISLFTRDWQTFYEHQMWFLRWILGESMLWRFDISFHGRKIGSDKVIKYVKNVRIKVAEIGYFLVRIKLKVGPWKCTCWQTEKSHFLWAKKIKVCLPTVWNSLFDLNIYAIQKNIIGQNIFSPDLIGYGLELLMSCDM